MKKPLLLAGALLAAAATAAVLGAQVAVSQPPARMASVSFTAAQATAGEAAYKQSCSSCHGANLDDGEFGPPLKGVEFRGRWGGTQSAAPLFSYMEERMPPAAPGSLGASTYAQILAYMFRENGIQSSNDPLPSDPAALGRLMMPGFVGGPSGGLAFGVEIPPAPARNDPFARYTPVTDAMLANPPAGEWLTWRRTQDSTGFSPLRQITKQNVGELRPAWVWSLPAGPSEATPLYHDGILFVHGFGDKLQALDAATGDLLWQYSHRLPMGRNAGVKRHIALYGDKVYMATSDVRVVALEAKTGRVVWNRQVADPEKQYGMTGGPTVAKGKIIVGTTGRAPGGNFIVALDANTGTEAWRFKTIAQPGEPYGETWNGLPIEKRNGGSVWVAGSYDPTLNLVYFGVAQTYDTGPLRVLQSGANNDALYTDTTVALNPDTGKLVWHFQHQPNDQWDYDWAFGRLIVTMPVGGASTRVVATAGKQAIYDVVEAGTGKYVSSMDLGVQDVIIGIDAKTGAKQINPRLIPDGRDTITTCPHAGGAKSWIPESYNPETKTIVVPLVEACMDLTPVAPGGRGSLSTGVRWTLRPRPDSDGKYGRLQAVNLETKKTIWTARQRAPQSSGALMTAGGVVFAGALDRYFAAYDDANGKELWRMRLNDVPSSAPISFMVNGKQYVAITVGNGGAQAATFPALVPEIRNPPDRNAAVWVFEVANQRGATSTR
jgi:alcohol dehydrogenase (cytochrome c)